MTSSVALSSSARYHVRVKAKRSTLMKSFRSSSNDANNKSERSSFKRWPQPIVESNGDYHQERFLEDVIGGPLYSKQSAIPHLPLPSIDNTISKFIDTAIPLAETEEEAKSLLQACEQFPKEAEGLQQRLIAKKQSEDKKGTSWLQSWWNTVGYLQFRDPVVVNVSYYFQLADDETIPLTNHYDSHSALNSNDLGVKRGAAILHAIAEYRKQVCTGSLPVETIGGKKKGHAGTPLCSVAFKYMFNACRIPQRGQDTYRLYDPSRHQHCIIACKGQFFSMDFVHEESGDPLSMKLLEEGLERCKKMAHDMDNKDNNTTISAAPRIGILTSSNRNFWADARAELIRSGGDDMKSSLQVLESGAALICLDDETPITMKECAEIYWHGGSTSGENRWFDKPLQFICQANGKAGFLGEHSMMDGMPIVGLCSHIFNTKYLDLIKNQNESFASDPSSARPTVKHLFGNFASSESRKSDKVFPDPKVLGMIQKAKTDFHTLIAAQQLDIQHFHGYGSNFIKKSGYSPDAFIQMVIQLASYRLFGKQVGTYEASQVRLYLHGRTETARSVSSASSHFVKSMGARPRNYKSDTDVDCNKHSSSLLKKNLSLFQAATQSQSNYVKDAGRGYGVDRHFFGLSMILSEEENKKRAPTKKPSLFDHPLYNRSKYWKLSTSSLPNAPGFGCVVPDGLGIAYVIKPNSCIFTITGQRENDLTDRASHLIEEALLELKLMIDLDNKEQVASKL